MWTFEYEMDLLTNMVASDPHTTDNSLPRNTQKHKATLTLLSYIRPTKHEGMARINLTNRRVKLNQMDMWESRKTNTQTWVFGEKQNCNHLRERWRFQNAAPRTYPDVVDPTTTSLQQTDLDLWQSESERIPL